MDNIDWYIDLQTLQAAMRFHWKWQQRVFVQLGTQEGPDVQEKTFNL